LIESHPWAGGAAFEFSGARSFVVFEGAGFRLTDDSRISRSKIRTLHEKREECGTQEFGTVFRLASLLRALILDGAIRWCPIPSTRS
jgi:hypothetical protein